MMHMTKKICQAAIFTNGNCIFICTTATDDIRKYYIVLNIVHIIHCYFSMLFSLSLMQKLCSVQICITVGTTFSCGNRRGFLRIEQRRTNALKALSILICNWDRWNCWRYYSQLAGYYLWYSHIFIFNTSLNNLLPGTVASRSWHRPHITHAR